MRHITKDPKTGRDITIDNVPMVEVRKLMKSLNLSMKEAADLWCYDNGKIGNAEAEKLTAKAKESGAARPKVSTKSGAKRKAPVRQPDEEKRKIVSVLAKALEAEVEGIGNINVENVERLITFSLGDNTFKLTLSKDRKPKN